MERLGFLYAFLVGFNVIFNQFILCTAFPEVGTIPQVNFGIDPISMGYLFAMFVFDRRLA